MRFRVLFEGPPSLNVFAERQMFSQKGGALISCKIERDAGTWFQHARAQFKVPEDMGAIEQTHGYIDAPTRVWISRTPPAERQPGDRDWALRIFLTSNCLKVAGTSTPSRFLPNGRPAENSKLKLPLRIYPTSPGLIRSKSCGAGSLVVAYVQVGYTKENKTTHHNASP